MPVDFRRFRQQTNFRLIIGFLIVLLVIGLGLVFVIYGENAAIAGFLFLVISLSPVVIIVIILQVLQWIINRTRK